VEQTLQAEAKVRYDEFSRQEADTLRLERARVQAEADGVNEQVRLHRAALAKAEKDVEAGEALWRKSASSLSAAVLKKMGWVMPRYGEVGEEEAPKQGSAWGPQGEKTPMGKEPPAGRTWSDISSAKWTS